MRSAESDAILSYNLPQDINCGNIGMYITSIDEITINGNGHTLYFEDRVDGKGIGSGRPKIYLDNIKIIDKELGDFPHYSLGCSYILPDELLYNVTLKSNVYVEGDTISSITVTNNATFKVMDFSVTLKPNAILNVLPKGEYDTSYEANVIMDENSVVNLKGYKCAYCNVPNVSSGEESYVTIIGNNSIVNICNDLSGESELSIVWEKDPAGGDQHLCKTVTINTNKEIPINYLYCKDYVTVNIDPNVCSQMNF